MTPLNILIVGGGFSGMSAAIELRKRGHAVDLVEIDPTWKSYGAGISLGSATLRAFATLGVLDEFLKQGFAGDGVQVCLPTGQQIAEIPTPRLAGPDVPGGGGILRPVLAGILADATRRSGTRVRLGTTFTVMNADAEGVDVSFTDGTRSRYDLVIGADGLYSKVRQMLHPEAAAPQYVGQGVWRAVLPRPADVTAPRMWVGPNTKPGVNPVSREEMYLFVTQNRPTNERINPRQFVPMLSELLEPFPAPLLQQIRGQLGEHSRIVYRPIEALLMPQPWHRGRIVMIGDTVHATTPHLASGACIGIEDAIVLAEELAREPDIESALRYFEARRWERCAMVVRNSARLAEIEVNGGDREEHTRVMRESLMALAAPI